MSHSAGPRAGGPRRAAVVHPGAEAGPPGRVRGGVRRPARAAALPAGGRVCTRRRSPSGASSATPGCWQGKRPGEKVGRPVGGAGRDRPAAPRAGADQAPSWRRPRRRLTIMGKAHALLEEISESADTRTSGRQALMAAYDELDRGGHHDPARGRADRGRPGPPRPVGTTRRRVHRSTGRGGAGEQAHRGRAGARPGGAELAAVRRPAAAADLRDAARRGRLPVLGRPRCTGSCGRTRRSRTVAGRPRHPPGRCPSWSRPGRGRCTPGTSPSSPGPVKGSVLRRLRDDRHLLPVHRRRACAPHRVRAAGGRDDDRGLRRPRHPAGRARRPGHLDDQQDRRGPARRPGRDPVPFPAQGLERQPVLRGVVQDPEVRAGLPRAVRLPAGRAGVHVASSSTSTTITTGTPGIGLHTPADVHYGHAADVQQRRQQTLAAARQQHPTRFTTTAATPKILNLPEASWINRPAAQTPAA